MYEIRKSFEVSAAHQLPLDYESPCGALHGHNWRITVYLRARTLDQNGMVMDFAHIKQKIKARLDHTVLNDVLPFPPTAENLAHFVCHELGDACYRVDILESADSLATYTRDDL